MSAATCSVDGCVSKPLARSWCGKHYDRWRRHGDPSVVIGKRYANPEESFALRTRRIGECLVWVGAKDGGGYGQMQNKGQRTKTHRYAWERANGPVPSGMEVDHLCRNPSCCRIEHLRLGSHKQNGEHIGVSGHNTSGYRGVSWHKGRKKWRAYVKHNGKTMHLGLFDTAREAGDIAKAKRNELFTHNNLDRKAA